MTEAEFLLRPWFQQPLMIQELQRERRRPLLQEEERRNLREC